MGGPISILNQPNSNGSLINLNPPHEGEISTSSVQNHNTGAIDNDEIVVVNDISEERVEHEPAAHVAFIQGLFTRAIGENRGATSITEAELTLAAGKGVAKNVLAEAQACRVEAERAMHALDKFKGSDLKSALDSANLSDTAAGKAIERAITAQLKLAEALQKCSDATGGNHALDELSMRANLRAAEISRLVGELDALAAKDPNNERLEERGQTAELSRIGAETESNRYALSFLEKKFATPLSRLEAFTAPDRKVSTAEILEMQGLVASLGNAIKDARLHGIDYRGDGSRTMVDPSVFASFEKTVKKMAARLLEQQAGVVRHALKNLGDGLIRDFEKLEATLPTSFINAVGNFETIRDICRKMSAGVRKYLETGDLGKLTEVRMLSNSIRNGKHELAVELVKFGKNVRANIRMISGLNLRKTAEKTLLAFQSRIKNFRRIVDIVAIASNRWLQAPSKKELEVRGTDLLEYIGGKTTTSNYIESQVLGLPIESFDEDVASAELVEAKPLGEGCINATTLCTFKREDGSTFQRVFKPEDSAWMGNKFASCVYSIHNDMPVKRYGVDFNRAAFVISKMIGAGDVAVQTKAGHLNGQFGYFMELAPGKAPTEIRDNNLLSVPIGRGSATPNQLRNATPEQKMVLKRQLAQKLNQLQWSDLLIGQMDRHDNNYMIDFSSDLKTVTVKGIDNDQCLTENSGKIGVFDLNGLSRKIFLAKARQFYGDESGIQKAHTSGAIVSDPNEEPLRVNYSLLPAPLRAAMDMGGFKNASVPTYMDRKMYVAIKNIAANMDGFREDLSKLRLTNDQIDALVSRFVDMVRIADDLDTHHRVFDFDNPNEPSDDVINSLFIKSKLTADDTDGVLLTEKKIDAYRVHDGDYCTRTDVANILEADPAHPSH